LKINIFIIITIIHTTLYPLHTQDKKMNTKPTIEYIVRQGKTSDRDSLKALYIKVASLSGSLVRSADEITDEYINNTFNAVSERGLIFVAEYNGIVIGSVSQYKHNIKSLSHVLDEASILVDPDYQGIGIGTTLYTTLLNEVKEHHPEIFRVDLKVRKSNPAIRLYERLGFKKEGEFKNLIRNAIGNLESVIAMTWFNPNFKDEQKNL
jgi:ribosomal protein S18 acetylase RimI-like enzyme